VPRFLFALREDVRRKRGVTFDELRKRIGAVHLAAVDADGVYDLAPMTLSQLGDGLVFRTRSGRAAGSAYRRWPLLSALLVQRAGQRH
jgi:hypothetical protein